MNAELVNRIKKILSENEQIIFAYLFGSSMNSEIHNDIDIAVYCYEPLENPFEVTSDLKMALSEATGLYPDFFDITLINYSLKSDRADSLLFLYEIFNGFLLLDRDPQLRTNLIEKTSLQLREIEGILKEVFA